MKIRTSTLVLGLAIVLGSTLAQAAEEARSIDIPAQSLATALRQFAEQTGLQLAFETALTTGRKAPAIKGRLTERQALTRLLAGTGLRYEYLDDRTVAVSPAGKKTGVGVKATTEPDQGAALQQTNASSPRREEEQSLNEMPQQKHPSSTTRVTTSEVTEMDAIIVTGTNIRGNAGVSPITVYRKSDIDRMGVFTAGDLMRNIPQNFALVDGETALNNGGNSQARLNTGRSSGVNLRGVGSGSTLTLLNGLRLAPGGADGSIVDISMIPLSAIDHVDVLTDGTSAIYGSDAVAGVVNFILQRDFTGAETTLRYGTTTDGGDTQRGIAQLFGTSWRSGNILVSYDKQEATGLRTNQRDFIPDALGGVLQILPVQDRQSGFISARQSLGDSLEIFATGLYGKRNFEQDISLFLPSNTTGSARQSMGAFGLKATLPADWRMESTAEVAETREKIHVRYILSPTSNFDTLTGMHSKLASFDLRADGPIASLPAGTARLSTGASLRRERFDDESPSAIVSQGSNLKRTVTSVFGEILVPLIEQDSSRIPIQRLEVSLAARYEHFDDVGSSTNPKVGILLMPINSLSLRATYASSFRAPPLAQLGSSELYYVYLLNDPASPTGQTNTLVRGTPGNPKLRPERARSFTAGLDFKPLSIPEFSASVTYYKLKYRDRIALPPVLGSIFNIYSQTETLAPFINRSPDPQELQRIYDQIGYLSADFPPPPTPPTPGDIQAYFDNSLQNIALMNVSGLESSITYSTDTRIGRATAFLSGDYRFQLENRPANTTPTVDLINTIYNPMDLRVRAGFDLSRGGAAVALTLNYSDGYKNNIVAPAANVASWSTIDLQLSYRASSNAPPFLRGTSVRVTAQNLLDRAPPFVENPANPFTNYGFDGTNASPRGRFMGVQITKDW